MLSVENDTYLPAVHIGRQHISRVFRKHKTSCSLGFRIGKNTRYISLFGNRSVIKDSNPVTNLFDNTHLMGYNYHRNSQTLIYIPDKSENRMRCLRIKRTRRLVAQKHFRLGSKRTRNRHTLFLTARQLGRICTCLIGKSYKLKKFHCTLFSIRPLHTLKFKRKAYVFETCTLHEKIKALKNHSYSAPDAAQFFFSELTYIKSVYKHRTDGRALQHIYAPYKCTFSRSAHSDYSIYITIVYRQRDISESFNFSIRQLEGFRQIFKFNHFFTASRDVCLPP